MIGIEAVAEGQVLTVPYEIVWHGETPLVAMAQIDSDKINPTFWRIALKSHAKRTSITPLDDIALDGNDARFVGAIHHITRCGSTTLLQQFGALDRIYALSEPMIFVELLARLSADQNKAAARVRKLACLFGKGFATIADRIVVKWPTLLCRHALELNEGLSHTPSVLILRNSVEVLASIEKRPLENMANVAPQLLCGPNETSSAPPEPTGLALTAKLLAANCRWIAQSTQTRLVDYAQLPDAGWEHVAPLFGIGPTAVQITQMQRASSVNAKQPELAFMADSGEKRRTASPIAQSLADEILQPAIDEARAALKSF